MALWLKILLRVIVGLVALVPVLWFGLAVFLEYNPKPAARYISAQLNKNSTGDVYIGSVEANLIKGFPDVSFTLSDVVLRDSLWQQHKYELLRVKNAHIRAGLFALLAGDRIIKALRVQNGTAYIYENKAGYSNTSMFDDNAPGKEKDRALRFHDVLFKNLQVSYQNDSQQKFFSVDIRSFRGSATDEGDRWAGYIKADAFMKSLAFNTEKGSYLKNKNLVLSFPFSYDKIAKVLDFPDRELLVDKVPYLLGARFDFGVVPTEFTLDIVNSSGQYKDVISILPVAISSKLDKINFKDPVAVTAFLRGGVKFRDTPYVRIAYKILSNVFTSPIGQVNKCSFTGFFENQVDSSKSRNDFNSAVNVFGFRGDWQGILVVADTTNVRNLVHPVIEGSLRSGFDLVQLNEILDKRSFVFDRGAIDINMQYRVAIEKTDTANTYFNGTVQVRDAAMTYRPRNLEIKNSTASLLFSGDHLVFKDVNLQTKSTRLFMNGDVRNLADLYYKDNQKLVLNWRIRSPQINLTEFLSFVGPRQTPKPISTPTAKKKGEASSLSAQLDKLLDESSVNMELDIDRLLYKKFVADNIKSALTLRPDGIDVANASLQHAGGRLQAKGTITQAGTHNTFNLNSQIEGARINEVFTAFNNFGLQTVTDQNVRGTVHSDIVLNGNLTNEAKIAPGSLRGTVQLRLEDGELIEFGAFPTIAKILFFRRNLSHIKINKLENTLSVEGDKVIIHPMWIESTAINMHVAGVYASDTGTNISIDIPIRKPKKEDLVMGDELREDRMAKGIIIRLKAVDGEDGKVKVKLGKTEYSLDKD